MPKRTKNPRRKGNGGVGRGGSGGGNGKPLSSIHGAGNSKKSYLPITWRELQGLPGHETAHHRTLHLSVVKEDDYNGIAKKRDNERVFHCRDISGEIRALSLYYSSSSSSWSNDGVDDNVKTNIGVGSIILWDNPRPNYSYYFRGALLGARILGTDWKNVTITSWDYPLSTLNNDVTNEDDKNGDDGDDYSSCDSDSVPALVLKSGNSSSKLRDHDDDDDGEDDDESVPPLIDPDKSSSSSNSSSSSGNRSLNGSSSADDDDEDSDDMPPLIDPSIRTERRTTRGGGAGGSRQSLGGNHHRQQQPQHGQHSDRRHVDDEDEDEDADLVPELLDQTDRSSSDDNDDSTSDSSSDRDIPPLIDPGRRGGRSGSAAAAAAGRGGGRGGGGPCRPRRGYGDVTGSDSSEKSLPFESDDDDDFYGDEPPPLVRGNDGETSHKHVVKRDHRNRNKALLTRQLWDEAEKARKNSRKERERDRKAVEEACGMGELKEPEREVEYRKNQEQERKRIEEEEKRTSEEERMRKIAEEVKRRKDCLEGRSAYAWLKPKLKGGSLRKDLSQFGKKYDDSIDKVVNHLLTKLHKDAWVEVEESVTSQVYKILFARDTKVVSDGTKEILRTYGGNLLRIVCEHRRKDDMQELVKAGTIPIRATLLCDILDEFPNGPNNDFSNVFVKSLTTVHLEKKTDFSAVCEAGNEKLSKGAWKKLKDLLKQGDSSLKKKKTRKAAVVSIPSAPAPQIEEVENGDRHTDVEQKAGKTARQPKREDPAIVKVREKFNERIKKLLRWYEEFLDQYKAGDDIVLAASALESHVDKDVTLREEKTSNEAEDTKGERRLRRSNALSREEIASEMERCASLPENKQEELIEQIVKNVDITDWGEESEWTIDITDHACKWFQKRSKKGYYFCERVISRLKLLSTGRWPYVLCKRLNTRSSLINLYEAKIDKASRIIWEVAIAFSPRRSSATQPYCEHVIRVWDIVEDHDNLTRSINLAVNRIEKSYLRGQKCILYSKLETKDDLNCQVDNLYRGGGEKVRLPKVFPMQQCTLEEEAIVESIQSVHTKKHFPPANDDEQQYNLLKFYELNAGAIKVLLAENASNVDLPFVPGPKEHEIIHYKSNPQRSILLMGRSGTGKTTCLVFRMWAQYMAYLTENGKKQPRQMFLTRNEVLRNEVQRSFQNMGLAWQKRSRDCTDSKQSDPIHYPHKQLDPESQPSDCDEYSFPIFLTTSEWLDLLDLELPGERFFSDAEAKKRAEFRKDHDTVLQGFDSFFDEEHDDNDRKKIVRKEMSYEEFRRLWPKINSREQSEIDPALVWLEIKSYIKGSVAALHVRDKNSSRFLSLEEYLALPRKQSRLDENQRRVVYSLYESYEKLKKGLHSYDEMDLVYNLASRMPETKSSSQPWGRLLPIHAVFVDEVQDFTQAELFILTNLCHSPDNLMLAGDTAQSIAVGVGFRFTDVRQIFYEKFGGIEPVLLQLNHNYRSHSGILKMAASVVELLYFFFSDSLDRLPPDLGLFPGPKPVIMEASSPGDFMYMIEGTKRETSRIEFGSNQVVIVRNSESKKVLLNNFDIDSEFIMTVQEAKGLEFNDVLLYNFFTDSDAKENWRVVSSYTASDIVAYYSSLPVAASGVQSFEWKALDLPPTRPLEFNLEMHKVLESELKMLYTAVTRARVNLFVVETSRGLSRPMFNYFRTRALVEVLDGKSLAGGSRERIFGKLSTKEEWQERGEYYLQHAEGLRRDNCLRLAAKCFEKAGDLKRKEHTLTYLAYAGIEDAELHSTAKARGKEQIERLYNIGCQLLEAEDVAFLNKAGWCLAQTGEKEYARSAHMFEIYARLCYAKRISATDTSSDRFGVPTTHEQRYFSLAAKLFYRCLTQGNLTPNEEPNVILSTVRNFLSSGAESDIRSAEELVNEYPRQCGPVINELRMLCTHQDLHDEWSDPTAHFRRQLAVHERGIIAAVEKIAALSNGEQRASR